MTNWPDRSSPCVTVISIGNAFAGDDGIAHVIVAALAARWRDDARVRFVELDGEPCRIVDEWRGARVVWVVDAMVSGREPGTIAELDHDVLPAMSASAARGSHAAGVADAIALGRAIGALPKRLHVFGIEVATFGPGPGLSLDVAGPRLTAAVNHLDHRLRAELGVRRHVASCSGAATPATRR